MLGLLYKARGMGSLRKGIRIPGYPLQRRRLWRRRRVRSGDGEDGRGGDFGRARETVEVGESRDLCERVMKHLPLCKRWA